MSDERLGEHGPANHAPERPLKILAVDDEALVLLYLTDLIEDLGHEAIPASSGSEALALLDANPGIDLLITDQSMPGMCGVDLALEVRKRIPELPIVLASGYGEKAGGDQVDLPCLAKPFTIAELESVMGSLARA